MVVRFYGQLALHRPLNETNLVGIPLLQEMVMAGGARADRALRVLGARARRPRVLLAEDRKVSLLVLQNKTNKLYNYSFI